MLDGTSPASMPVVAMIKGGTWASLRNGLLVTTGPVLSAWRVAAGKTGADESACTSSNGDLSITANPRSAQPKLNNGASTELNQSTLFIRGGVGTRFTIRVVPVANSGGHDHHDNNRPFGRLRAPDVANAPNNNEGEHTFQGVIGTDGTARVIYTSSIVGGREQLIAQTLDGQVAEYTGEDGEIGMMVRIPGLQLLADGANYTKIGGTMTHHGPGAANAGWATPDNNHWGTTLTLQRLAQIADAYAELYPGSKLGINDMSLPFGGTFDLTSPKYTIFWGSGGGHSEHKVGINCDLSDNIPGDRWDALEEIINQYSPTFLPEHDKNHWHLRITK